MKYILDTNAVSALMRGEEAVVSRLRDVDRGEVGVPRPVFAEIAYGIERSPRSARRLALEARFDLVRTELTRAPWTDAVSEQFGAVEAALERRGERIENFDAAIAAHALAERAMLVTSNLDHMARVPGLRIEDWALVQSRR